MGGRIDAIGLSVVMPEGPRRIPGRLSVAPAPPAVRKLSGDVHLECIRLSDSGWRVSLVWAQCSSHALCDRATVSLFLRTPDCGLGAGSGKGREFDNVRHYLRGDNAEDIHWKATNCGPLALVSRAYSEILGTRPSVRLRRWRVVPSQGSPCLKIATRRPF